MNSFSLELLLSHIEFVQYQQWMMETMDVQSDLDLTQFPSNIPISEIIECEESDIDTNTTDKGMRMAKMKAHKIFRKYVAFGSEYEINIGYSERSRLDGIVGDLGTLLSIGIKADELFVLFQKCDNQMVGYLKHHLSKFRGQSEFDQIVSIFAATPSVPVHIKGSVEL